MKPIHSKKEAYKASFFLSINNLIFDYLCIPNTFG